MQDRPKEPSLYENTVDVSRPSLPEEIRWKIYSYLPFFQLSRAQRVASEYRYSLTQYANRITTPKAVVEYLNNASSTDGQAFVDFYYHTKRHSSKPLEDMTPMEVFAYTLTRKKHEADLVAILEIAMHSEDYASLSVRAKDHLRINLLALMLTCIDKQADGAAAECDALITEISDILISPAFAQEKNARFINLAEIDLSESGLTGVNLSGAYMPGAKLVDSILIDTNLTEAYLYGADLSRSRLSGSKLNKANLTAAAITDIRVDEETDFSQACLLTIPRSDDIDAMIGSLTAQLKPYLRLREKNSVLLALANNIKAIASQISDVTHRLRFIQAAINDYAFPHVHGRKGQLIIEEGSGLKILTDLRDELSDLINPVDGPKVKR